MVHSDQNIWCMYMTFLIFAEPCPPVHFFPCAPTLYFVSKGLCPADFKSSSDTEPAWTRKSGSCFS